MAATEGLRGRFALALATLAALGGVSATSALAGTEHGVNRAKLAKKAERIIEERNGIDVIKISRCSPQKRGGKIDYAVWKCFWRAVGEYTGQVPYQCAGAARWKRKGNAWTVEACLNTMQPQAPLLDVPNPHPLFGFNDDWAAHLLINGPARAAAVTEALKETEGDVIRMNIVWGSVEPNRGGALQWSSYDNLNQRFQALGLRPLWVVIGSPCWARAGACNAANLTVPPEPGSTDEYGDFAAKVAARYPGSVGIEVWNEPNYPRFWGGADPDPVLFSAILKEAAESVHAAVPGMPVISGGLSPHADGDEAATGFRDFLKRMYELGGAQAVDAIGIHPYPGVGPEEDYVADVRVYLGKVQRAIADAGDSATPMWATEFGVSTTGPHAFSADQQAQALGELYEILRRVDRVDVAIVHRFVEDPALAEREAGFGVLNQNLSRKLAFCALKSARGIGC